MQQVWDTIISEFIKVLDWDRDKPAWMGGCFIHSALVCYYGDSDLSELSETQRAKLLFFMNLDQASVRIYEALVNGWSVSLNVLSEFSDSVQQASVAELKIEVSHTLALALYEQSKGGLGGWPQGSAGDLQRAFWEHYAWIDDILKWLKTDE